MMKTKVFFYLFGILLMGFPSVFGQGFRAPVEGKAVIYFVRVTLYGAATPVKYFHNDRFIGVFTGRNYLRYECEPGEQLFWASSENKEFVTADLKAGGTYILLVDVVMGRYKPRIEIEPVSSTDERFSRARELIVERPPIIIPKSKIDKKNARLTDFIPKQLGKYNNDWKTEKNFKHISSDMAIPEELVK